MTTVNILMCAVMVGICIAIFGGVVWADDRQVRLRAAEHAEADYQLERYIHTNFPVGSTHELKGYGRVQFKRYTANKYNPDSVIFWTAGPCGGYHSGQIVNMSWRLFQELLIEESEE